MCHHPAGILETETKNVLVPTQSAIALCHPRPWELEQYSKVSSSESVRPKAAWGEVGD